MDTTIWTTLVTVRPGEEIIVAKLPKGSLTGRWHARKIINAVRATGPLHQIASEVVVMDGEPNSDTLLIGSTPEAEAFARSHLTFLQHARWQSRSMHMVQP